MKKLTAFLICAAVALSTFFSAPANAAYDDAMAELKLNADCLLLMSADNGEIIFEKNIRKQTAPASLTKIVTAIVVIESCDNLNQTVTVSEESIKELSGTGSSVANLKVGEKITVYDLLCYLMIMSANDAATTLANFVTNGDRAAFITKMNETAKRLGCTNTNFVNPHGLDNEDQYTTAEDLAKLMSYAMSLVDFAEITGKLSHTVAKTNMRDERRITNTCYLLNKNYPDYYCEYAKSGKTGTTSNAGRCLVSYASNDGYNYIAIALGAEEKDFDKDGKPENGALLDCKTMFNWAFDNLELVAVSDPEKVVGEVKVNNAKSTDYVSLIPAETIYSLVPLGTDKGSVLIEPVPESMPESLNAPVKKGDVVCKGRVLYAGEVLCEIDLVAANDVERSITSVVVNKTKSFLLSPVFIALAVIIPLAVALAVFLIKKKKRSKARPVSGKDYRVLGYNDFMNIKK